VTGLPLDTTTVGAKTTVTFWMNWNGTNNTMPIGWYLHDIWITGSSIGFNTGNGDLYGTSNAGLANGWHHISVEFTNGSVTGNKIFIDGIEKTLTQRQGSPVNSRAVVNSELRIGGWSYNAGYNFYGLIDEVRVYQQGLTAAQVQAIMQERHTCFTAPFAEYRFDEPNYSDVDGEVVDSIGGLNGRTKSAQPEIGKMCTAVDLSATGTGDYVILDKNILTGQTEFSVSAWIKTSKNGEQSVLSGAGADSSNELLMWFTSTSRFSPFLNGSNNGNVDGLTLSDNNWHHLVWTYDGIESCIYQDKNKIGCIAQPPGQLNIQSLIIGQEQDSIGGGFVSSQAFDGLLDELLVYHQALNQSEIDSLYNKQNIGLNFDGSSRACPLPVAYYQFEEEIWENTGDVLDSTEYVNHGTAIGNSSPFLNQNTQKSCQALDIPKNTTNSVYDAVDTGYDINDLGSKGTISFWYRSNENWNSGEHKYLFDASKVSASRYFLFYIHNANRLVFSLQDDTGGAAYVYSKVLAYSANEWVHLAISWDLRANDYYLLINGQPETLYSSGNTIASSTLGDLDTLYIGDNRSTIFNEGNSANGQIDNFKIYNFVQNQTEIQTDMQDNNTCYYVPTAEYRFDESSYEDVPNEVIENIAGLSGRAKSAQTVPGKICNAVDLSAAGTSDYVILNEATLDGLTDFTVAIWLKTSKQTVQSILSGAGVENNDLLIYLPDSESFGPFIKGTGLTSTPISTISNDTWQHLVWTRKDDKSCIYQNKVLMGCVASVSSAALEIQGLILGQDQDNVGGGFQAYQSFDGLLDELLIYDQALPATQIGILYDNQNAGLNYDGSGRDNASCIVVDHYRIEHDTKGFTCEAEPITIKACLTESCDTLYDQPTTITLLPPGWTGGDTLTFTGQTTTTLSITEQSTITFSKGAASKEAPMRCFSGSDETCDIQFVNDGFEFYDANGGPNLPDQIAADNFVDLNLRAVRNDQGVCKALLAGEQDITLIYECDTPNVCLTPFAGIAISGDGSAENSGTVSLTFNSEGIASLSSFSYADAGRVKLKAQAEIDNVTITATTNGEPLDIYPSYLALSVDETVLNYAGSTDENNYLAGDNFTLVVGAYGTNDQLLPNYQSGNPQLKVTRLAPSAAGMDGTLRYADSGNKNAAIAATFENTTTLTFNNGEYRYLSAYYSEVGRIEVDFKDNNYLGNQVTSISALILGNFYPAYFSVALSQQPILADSSGTFTYLGQDITFSTDPELTITAFNALNQITKNYGYSTQPNDNFWSYLPSQTLLNSSLSYLDSSSYNATGSATVVSLGDSPIIQEHANFDGTGTITINNGRFKYDKFDPSNNQAYAKVSPFEAKVDLVFDSDFFNLTVNGQGGAQSICYKDNHASSSCKNFTIEDIQGTQLRYGRLVLESTYGPETERLNVPIKTEYFDTGQWLLNTDDHFTSIELSQTSDQIKVAPIDGYNIDLVGEVVSTGQLIMGQPVGDQLTLEAPCDTLGQCFQGQLRLSLNPEAIAVEWPTHLNYDWSGDGNIDSDDFPKSIVSFGQFRSNDRIIQWREVFN
jgi:MSHA biogenesis protein MshQ